MVFNKGSERIFLRFKKTPRNTFPKNGLAGVLKMGALMYQIHMKPGTVLLSRFGFKSRVFIIFVRSVLETYTKLD